LSGNTSHLSAILNYYIRNGFKKKGGGALLPPFLPIIHTFLKKCSGIRALSSAAPLKIIRLPKASAA